jgi:hypothetical protein
MKQDQVSTPFSIERRIPFLDRPFVESTPLTGLGAMLQRHRSGMVDAAGRIWPLLKRSAV